MAEKNIAENPYHVSFKLCAEDARRGDGRATSSQQSHNNRYRDTFYDEYLKIQAEFYCSLCDRGFKNEHHLNAHNSEHITCGREGCTFTAHEKIVANHVRMQHATGLFSKIKKLDNPEEIKKWLDERKRKYPTLKVAENKIKLQEARKRRGERIDAPNDRFNKDFSKGKSGKFSKTRGRGKKRKKITQKQAPDVTVVVEESPVELFNGGIPAFRGIGSMSQVEDQGEYSQDGTPVGEENKFAISDDEELGSALAEDKPVIANSLGLLMNAYDSDALSDEPEEVPSKPAAAPTQPLPADDEEAPDEVPTVTSKVQTLPQPETRLPQRKQKRGHNRKELQKQVAQPVRRLRKPTLLQKLLTPDINRERCLIRECVHYVVQNNFFENQPEKTSTKTATHTQKVQQRKSRLLEKLLKDDIVHERNLITQCVRFVIQNNFFDVPKVNNES